MMIGLFLAVLVVLATTLIGTLLGHAAIGLLAGVGALVVVAALALWTSDPFR